MKMKQGLAMAACCAMLALPGQVWAQDRAEQKPPAPKMAVEGTPIAPGESLNAVLSLMEQQVVGAAEAMPADKYDFTPTGPGDFKDVRSFSSQVKHLAESNYGFFHGWGVPGAVDPKTIEALKSKDEIVKALKDSYKYAHTAIHSITLQNAFTALKAPEEYKATRVSFAAFCVAHSMDHYGQMVEYLRMNGIIPPASRK